MIPKLIERDSQLLMGGKASKQSATTSSVLQEKACVPVETKDVGVDIAVEALSLSDVVIDNAKDVGVDTAVEAMSLSDVVTDNYVTKSGKLEIGRESSLSFPSHLLRQASIGTSDTLHECFCTDPVIGDIGHLRLKCMCLIHYHCLVSYIRNKLGDRSSFFIGKGICCPYMRECKSLETEDYFINVEDLETLIQYTDKFSPRSLSVFNETLTIAEVDKFQRYTNGDDDAEIITTNSAPLPSNEEEEDLSEKYINATTKPCPSCSYRATHFHGHMCHHVNEGCLKCKTHFCYRCLCTAEENFLERGSRGACKCGAWSNFCSTVDLVNNLDFASGFPIDKRCGCGPCPECKFHLPCGTCNGRCCVCIGILSPGPNELVTKNTWNHTPTGVNSKRSNSVRDGADIEAIRAHEELIARQARADAFLSLCAHRGNIEHVRSQMTDVNIQGRRGYTGLYAACVARNYEVVHMLVREPAIRVDIRSMDGSTPLYYCCSYGLLDVAKLLLEHGAGIDATDNNGWTALYISCLNGVTNVVKFLLERGARCHLEVSNSGWRPLHAAAYSGDVGCVEALLSYGAEIDCQDRNNRTPLFVAAMAGQVAVISLLLAAGADKFIADSESNTPDKLMRAAVQDATI